MRHSPGRAVDAPPEDEFESRAPPPHLPYPRLLSSVVRRPPFNCSVHSQPEIFEKIVVPYDANAFEFFLDKFHLLDSYPDLVSFLRHGFPIGSMPPLDAISVLDNHPSIHHHSSVVDEYLDEEMASGRLDGPFSKSEVSRILRGSFQSSPLVVAIQPQAPGEPDKVRICRHLSKSKDSILSVNSFIKTTEFPTRFDTAASVAELVSLFVHFFIPPSQASFFKTPHSLLGSLPLAGSSPFQAGYIHLHFIIILPPSIRDEG